MKKRTVWVARPARSAIAIGAIGAMVGLAIAGGVATQAHAATSTASATAIAQAAAVNPAIVTAASFQTQAHAETGGVSTDTLGQFPRSGSSYGVLSTGRVSSMPNPGTLASTDLDGGNVRGNTDLDVTVLKIDLNLPTGTNCLAFDFKFLSEEHPVYVGTSYNDAFIAELGSSTWTTSGSTISAPNNFAFDAAGKVVSVNSTGVGGMSPAEGAGTAFDGSGSDTNGAATTLLSAAKQTTAGPQSLYLSIFDQGDRILDSAVFVDNLRAGYVAEPAKNCASGAQVVTHSMKLTPPTGTADVGGSHTVTATVMDSNDKPVTSGTVEFTTTGTNSHTEAVGVNASGQATMTYSGSAAGTDTISACYKPDPSSSCAADSSVTFTWTPAATPKNPLEILCETAKKEGPGATIEGRKVVLGKGGSGHQIVLGSDGGNATLSGGSGNDVLCAWGGNNVLEGGSGDDALVVLDGANNKLIGDSGDDTLIGFESDTFDGGTGKNTIIKK